MYPIMSSVITLSWISVCMLSTSSSKHSLQADLSVCYRLNHTCYLCMRTSLSATISQTLTDGDGVHQCDKQCDDKCPYRHAGRPDLNAHAREHKSYHLCSSQHFLSPPSRLESTHRICSRTCHAPVSLATLYAERSRKLTTTLGLGGRD